MAYGTWRTAKNLCRHGSSNKARGVRNGKVKTEIKGRGVNRYNFIRICQRGKRKDFGKFKKKRQAEMI